MRSSRQTETGSRQASRWAIYLIRGAYSWMRASTCSVWHRCTSWTSGLGVVLMELSFIAYNTGCGAASYGNPVTISRIYRGRRLGALRPPFRVVYPFSGHCPVVELEM